MIRSSLDRFFRRVAPTATGDTLLVAFSGGPDSTSLLYELAALSTERGFDLRAAHLDHGLDPGSATRARRAAELADALGVPLSSGRIEAAPRRPSGGLEDWARRHRYRYLEETRLSLGARYLVTAHHRDDQIETILMRWSLGSGLAGLAAMRPRRGALVRPCLEIDRETLHRSLERSGLEPIADPTNSDPARVRNRLRHHLLPHLERSDRAIGERLLGVARACRDASRTVEMRLERHLDLHSEAERASIDLRTLRALPRSLVPFALAILHRAADRPYPAGRSTRRELLRQLDSDGRVGCDCGDGWSWTSRGDRLVLARRETAPGPFAYTLAVPGEVAIHALGLRLSIRREPVAPWMFEGRPQRAALRLPIDDGESLVVRNRRPGDRVRPLGCRYTRRLKDVLIDRGVPRRQRDRLPLLCRGDRILWVPGVTIDDDLRVGGQQAPWVARLEPAAEVAGELQADLPCCSD